MSKVLEATCVGGVVSVGGVPVPGVVLLSEGVANSTGILIIDEMRAYYITNVGNDLDTTLGKVIEAFDKVIAALEKAVDSLTTLDTTGFLIGAAGAVPSPPVATADIAGITSAAAELEGVKAELETLKGSLQ